MDKELEAYNKIDNTLFLNNFRGSLGFNMDTEENKDCKDLKELVDSLITVRECIFQKHRFQKALDIITQHNVDIYLLLYVSVSAKDYNSKVSHGKGPDRKLSEEDYQFLVQLLGQ